MSPDRIHEGDGRALSDDDDDGDGDEPVPRVPLGVGARAQLAAAMAHEVRNPLNSLAIHSDLLQTRLERLGAALGPDERAAITRSLVTMGAEIERVDRILEGYLDMVGPEEPERQAIAPRQLVEEALAHVRDAARAAGVRIETRQAAEEGAAWAVDREPIVDTLATIIAHAVAASAAGARVEVEVVPAHDGYAELRVRGGPAQPPEALTKAFSFTGIGGAPLIVARQLAKSHGGSLSLQRADDTTLYTLRIAVD